MLFFLISYSCFSKCQSHWIGLENIGSVLLSLKNLGDAVLGMTGHICGQGHGFRLGKR